MALVAGAALVALLPGVASSKNSSASFHDPFSKSKELEVYGVDRSLPLDTEFVTQAKRKCLQLTVGHDFGDPDPFYNFQGYIRYADENQSPLALPIGARASVRIFVPDDWEGDVIRGADLWVRIDDPNYDVGYDAYPTAGFYNYGDGEGTCFSIFLPYTGEILDFYDAPFEYGEWNTVEMVWKATGVEFYCNGELQYLDDTPDYADCLALEAIFLQGWRAGDLSEDYDIWFDDAKGLR
jgi:hypothetical protein